MKIFYLSVVGMLLCIVFSVQLVYAKGSTVKPNIIYILADDAGIGDFGCYGGNKIMTPNVDQLAKEGIKFTQHYSGSTVCAPSRSCLITGQHTGHTRVRGNGKAKLHKDDFTIAEMLKEAGYKTGCIGKWGLGNVDDSGNANDQGFDFFYGFYNQGRAHRYYPDYLWKNKEKILFPDNPIKRTDYAHDHFTKEALSFIEKNKNEPFFLYMAYTVPHVDLDVPEESMKHYYKKFKDETPYDGKKGGYRAHPTPHAAFAGMITRLDRDLGTIQDLIEELGLDDNTIIIFASDNGATAAGGADPDFFDSNGIFRGIKRDLYEGGIRTPFVARWPGKIKPGTESNHISAFWDMMPTFAEIAGVKIPKQTDGISILPSLLGNTEKQNQHDYMYWEFFEKGGKQAIRKGDWKAVRLNVNENRNAALELYNLKTDIGETNNVAKEHSEIVKEFERLMIEARTESDIFKFGIKKKKRK